MKSAAYYSLGWENHKHSLNSWVSWDVWRCWVGHGLSNGHLGYLGALHSGMDELKKHLETTKLWVNLFLCGTHGSVTLRRCATALFPLPVIVRSTDQKIFKNQRWPHSKLTRWHLPGASCFTIAIFGSWILPNLHVEKSCMLCITNKPRGWYALNRWAFSSVMRCCNSCRCSRRAVRSW